METFKESSELVSALSADFRLINLGGVAVIAHGMDRNTFDTDIWLEPFSSPSEWTNRLRPYLYDQSQAIPVSIGNWEPISLEDLPETIGNDGVIRINGLDRPLDIFRKPNELEAEQFDEVWARARPLDDGTRLPDAIDLLVTKMMTDREKDLQDIAFLEAKVEKDYLERLPRTAAAEAEAMLGRFLSPRVAEVTLAHPEASVRDLALHYLREMTEEGNPFARDILEKVEKG